MKAITYYLNNELYRVHTAEPDLTDDELVAMTVPQGAQDVTVHEELIYPEDPMFQAAWQLQGSTLVEDLGVSKEIAHHKRRRVRDQEFTPWDRKVTVPSEATAAEAERELIRQKYAQIQTDIDTAADMSVLRTVVKSFI